MIWNNTVKSPSSIDFYDLFEDKLLSIFNSSNFHEVKPSSNLCLSLGGHVGINENGEILMWV